MTAIARTTWLALLAMLASGLYAQSPDKLGPREKLLQEDVTSMFLDRAAEIDKRLRAGEWKRAERHANQLYEEMLGMLTIGTTIGDWLSLPIMLRAVARTGLGEDRDALWDLEMATALSPRIATASFSDYGEAGAKLVRMRQAASSPPSPSSLIDLNDPASVAGRTIEKPRRTHSPDPRYPLSFLRTAREGAVTIRTEIDVDGVLHHPAIVDMSRGGPVAAACVLDALRNWKFEPAIVDGRPVRVLFNLTVNFMLR
jgi:TonB family protein